MAFVLQHRKDTAAKWASNNPTLEAGEIGVESDTNGVKVGDGSTAWKALPYINEAEVDSATLFPTKAPDTGGRDIFYKNDVHGAININLGNLEPGQSLIFNHKDTSIPTLGTGIVDCWGLKFKYLKQFADNWLKLTKVNQTTALLQGLTDRPYGITTTLTYYYPGSITTDTWLYAFPQVPQVTQSNLTEKVVDTSDLNSALRSPGATLPLPRDIQERSISIPQTNVAFDHPSQSSPSAHAARGNHYVMGIGYGCREITIPSASGFGDPAGRFEFYGDYYNGGPEVPASGTGALRRWDYYRHIGFSTSANNKKNFNSPVVTDFMDYATETRQLKYLSFENIYPSGVAAGPLWCRCKIEKPGTELINPQVTVSMLLPFNTFNHSDP